MMPSLMRSDDSNSGKGVSEFEEEGYMIQVNGNIVYDEDEDEDKMVHSRHRNKSFMNPREN